MKFFQSIAVFLSATLMVASSYMLMGGTLDSFLDDLRADGAISARQHKVMTVVYLKNVDLTFNQHQVVNNIFIPLGDELRSYIEGEERSHRLSDNTATYLRNLFNLEAPPGVGPDGGPDPILLGPSYTANGIVTKGGHINVQNENSDATIRDFISNGIWGYETGRREYALQCSSDGFRIIDVTNTPFIVQFIPMTGGIIWRDVETHTDPATKVTYAYVGAQGSGGTLWVVNLSELSGTTAHGPNSDPIPSDHYKDIGFEDFSHTLSVSNGLLFLNSGGFNGCQIFDLMVEDPMIPFFLSSTKGNQRDCHDSFSRMVNGRLLLFAADGYTSRVRIHDITDIRSKKAPVLLGETEKSDGTYAHSVALTDDSKYMYTFDEFDNYDIAVYDISNVRNPVQIRTFQWKGEESEGNSIIHNGFVRGNFLLTAYYQAGFRVFDITNPTEPVEVGNYETYRDPEGSGVLEPPINKNYQGAWNLYSGLSSGKILVSDMQTGTFVLTLPSLGAPEIPASLSGSLGPCGRSRRSSKTRPTLKWDRPSEAAAPEAATSYLIYRSNNLRQPYVMIDEISSAERTYRDSAELFPDTYYYTVTAKNSEAESNAPDHVEIEKSTSECKTTRRKRRRRRRRRPVPSRPIGSRNRTPELT
eukprot:scaffold31315_cov49-Attheya_sp.AAC.2